MNFKDVMYYNFMDFEQKKPKLQKAVKEWKKGGAPLKVALEQQGIDVKSLTNFEENYLEKLLEN